MLEYSPFQDLLVQKLELMNEITALFLVYSVMTFSAWIDPEDFETRHYLGIVFCVIMGLNIATHLFFLLKSLYKDVKGTCLRKCKGKHHQ